MELEVSLPHSQESTTCPYPSQINPFLCPSHFWQTQLVSFLVGLRTYQHSGIMRNVSGGKKVVQNDKTRILYSIYLFRNTRRLGDGPNVEIYGTARQATGDNTIRSMEDAICVPDNARIRTHIRTIHYWCPLNRQIPPDLVKCFTSTLQIGNGLSVITTCLANSMSKKYIRERTWFCFNAAFICSVCENNVN